MCWCHRGQRIVLAMLIARTELQHGLGDARGQGDTGVFVGAAAVDGDHRVEQADEAQYRPWQGEIGAA
ncbi:hypothetical protein D3C81_1702830 [compost metagenome]